MATTGAAHAASPARRNQDRAAVRVGVLGYGNVGSALVAMLLAQRADIAARSGVELHLVGVAVADPSRPRSGLPPLLLAPDAKALVADPDVDVIVELIGGVDPARGLVESALGSRKPVVTANKELIAAHGAALAEVAAVAGVDLLYEAAVAGAIPLVRALRESLAGEHVRRLMGIVNGTTNFILTAMSEDGLSYTQALAEAQRLGFAERDPTADVDGHDAAAKAAILASLAFRSDVVAEDVPREGIATVHPIDVAFGARLGYVVKLLAVIERVDTDDRQRSTTGDPAPTPEISARVHPAMLPSTHPLASVRGAFNAVFVEGDGVGELMLYGRGAGGRPTASAVLGDLIDAAHHLRTASPPRRVELVYV